jgi:hypothetical protein
MSSVLEDRRFDDLSFNRWLRSGTRTQCAVFYPLMAYYSLTSEGKRFRNRLGVKS